MKKKYNLGVDSKKLVKFIESIKKDKKDKIQKDLNLTNLITFLSSNYTEFSKKEIKLVKSKKKIKRNNVFMDNIDTCGTTSGVNKNRYLLNIELVLSFLNKNNKEIILKMLKLHKYPESKKQELLIFLDNLENYDKEYIIEWMNLNGIELMRSLYIFLLNNKLPKQVYQILGEEREIYGEFTSLDIQEEIELSLPKLLNKTYRMDNLDINLIMNSREKIKIHKDFVKRCFFLHYLLKDTKPLTIKFWLSGIKKSLPKPREEIYLGPKEVNSGCSNKVEITLWRKEEVSKVLIHEIIHHLDLENFYDLIQIQEYVYSKFDIRSSNKINFFESYTEIWANIINICLLVFSEKKDIKKSNSIRKFNNIRKPNSIWKTKKRFNAKSNDILTNIIDLLNIELSFSLFQCAKILHFYGYRSFREMYNPNGWNEEEKTNKYYQKSNVFSYYIGRSLLFYNFNRFLEECFRYNIESIMENRIPASIYIQIMEDTINNTNYINEIDNLINKMDHIKENSLIRKCMRFSAVEYNFIL